MWNRFLDILRAVALVAAASAACADDVYSSRTVRVIVPYAMGSSADVLARLLTERLSKNLKQPFVVDNRAGAGGAIGVSVALKAPADGYTILITTSSPLVINPVIDKRTPYDVERDVAPIALLAGAPLALVAAPSIPANNLDELIAYLKRNPGKYSYASSGQGSYSHVIMELFKQATGVDVVHVAYKGPTQGEIDIMGGQVTLMFGSAATATTHIRSGRLRAFGVSSKVPFSLWPEIAPLALSGRSELQDFDVSGWVAIAAPIGTPPAVVAKLNAEINAALQSPDFQDQLKARSVAAFPPNKPEDLARLIRYELDRWRKVAKVAKVAKIELE